ncbi:MAG: peptidoglycan-binding protein, partial [Limnospira maxima]
NQSNPSSILLLGSRGADVIALQQRLQQLGYYTGMIDGVFGESTRVAVVRFQRDNAITQTGQVGPTTQFHLARATIQRPIIPAVPAGPGFVVRPVATNPNTYIAMGNAGENVRRIQRRLRELGFYNGPINGFFDGQTQNAVIQFQQAYNITTTGIVGPTTETYLFNLTRPSFGHINQHSVSISSSHTSPGLQRQAQK